MSAADDLKRFAEVDISPNAIMNLVAENRAFVEKFTAGSFTVRMTQMLDAIVILAGDNRSLNERIGEARGMLTFYCEDYCTCEQDPHVGSDTDGLDPPCLTILTKEWFARLADDLALANAAK